MRIYSILEARSDERRNQFRLNSRKAARIEEKTAGEKEEEAEEGGTFCALSIAGSLTTAPATVENAAKFDENEFISNEIGLNQFHLAAEWYETHQLH